MGSPPACEYAQGHPSPAKQCVFTTSAATIRCGAMVVWSRIGTTIADAMKRNSMMPLRPLLVLRLHTLDTILYGLFLEFTMILLPRCGQSGNIWQSLISLMLRFELI